jgi:hypothetical protein
MQVLALLIVGIVAVGLGVWLLIRKGESPDDILGVLRQAQRRSPMLSRQWFKRLLPAQQSDKEQKEEAPTALTPQLFEEQRQLPAQQLLQAQQLDIQKRQLEFRRQQPEIQKRHLEIQKQNREALQKLEEERLKKESAELAQRTLRERRIREYQSWRLQHSTLVDKFLEITERKVSLLDDYGDENWDALPKDRNMPSKERQA